MWSFLKQIVEAKRSRRRGAICAPSIGRRVRHLMRRWRPNSREEHNERVLYGEIIFQAINGAGAMSFLSVFLVRLGAPNWLVGLFTSLPALIIILTILPAGAFVEKQRDLVKTVNWTRFVWRGVTGCFAFLPFLPTQIAAYILVAARALLSVPGAVLNVANTTIIGQATTPERRPAMLSMRMAIHSLVAAGVGLAAGQWLDRVAFPLNYQILFASAFLAGLGSIYTLSHLKLDDISAKDIADKRRVGLRELVERIGEVRGFRNYALAAFIFRMGMSFPGALISIYRVRTLGCSDAWIGVLMTVQRLVNVASFLLLGRLLSRPKFRRWLWLSCLGQAFYPFAMALARTPEMLLVSSAVGGIFVPGMNIFLSDTLYRVSPEEERPTFVAANTFLANVTAFVAPLLGTLLSDLTFIRLALIAATFLRALGGVAFWRLGVGGSRELTNEG